MKPSDSKEAVRVIKCSRGSDEAARIYASIQEAMRIYGPYALKVTNSSMLNNPAADIHRTNVFYILK